ncbi:MAG: GIY-YIG nuclease family protein [Candidatus Aminicenantes bacterium]|nr:GIY-YIG nuclease family protein [Candidatus Aminicenantes bacterium]
MIDHPLHRKIGEWMEEIVQKKANYWLERDKACLKQGGHTLPLYCEADPGTLHAFQFTNVDMLILEKNYQDKVRVVIEIEESNIKPLHIFGKFLAAAMCNSYRHNGEKYELSDSVMFVQFVKTVKKGAKREQFQKIEEAIKRVMRRIKRKISAYELFEIDFEDIENKTINLQKIETRLDLFLFGGFYFVYEIKTKLNENDEIKEYFPQKQYQNWQNAKIHKYGRGPFCRFSIPKEYQKRSGVYLLVKDNIPIYVGECEDLTRRYNIGYGLISPRSCYEGGQQTNCRINNLILEAKKKGERMDLFFVESENRFALEDKWIYEFRPNWNLAKMGISRPAVSRRGLRKGEIKPNLHKGARSSKYSKLEEYLKNIKESRITLTYKELENICGFVLPKSAYNHEVWWSNGGHSHANSWLRAGWIVEQVYMGEKVVFSKAPQKMQ